MEHLLVAQEHVTTGFEIVLLVHTAALNLARQREASLWIDESHIVNDEHIGLTGLLQVYHRPFRIDLTIATSIKSPGAAEGTIPRAPTGKLDRGARIERADEILATPRQQIASGSNIVQILNQFRGRSFSGSGDDAGQGVQIRTAIGRPLQ